MVPVWSEISKKEVESTEALKWLSEKDPLDRICGAEINAIAHMLKAYGKDIEAGQVCLYLSDTDDGRFAGDLLEKLLPRFFGRVKVSKTVIEKLDPSVPDAFRRRGLHNLVMNLASDVRRFGRPRCIMNVTGGFKVVVALAQGLANATGIPAYYKFEFSDAGMIPLGLDVGIWLRLNDVLYEIDEEDIVEELRYRELKAPLAEEDRKKLDMLMEDIQFNDGENHKKRQRVHVYALSALGELYRQLAQSSFWENEKNFMPKAVDPSQKVSKVSHKGKEAHMLAFEAKHGIGKKLLKIPFVASVHTHYYKKGGKTIGRCHIQNKDEREIEVELGNNMGIIKYVLHVPTASNEEQLRAACLGVNEILKGM